MLQFTLTGNGKSAFCFNHCIGCYGNISIVCSGHNQVMRVVSDTCRNCAFFETIAS